MSAAARVGWVQRHVHPTVTEHAAALAHGGPIVMSQCEAPGALMAKHDMTTGRELHPPAPLPRKRQKMHAIFVAEPAVASPFLAQMRAKMEFVDMIDTRTMVARAEFEE